MTKRILLPEESLQVLLHWYPEQLLRDTPFFKETIISYLFGIFGTTAITINKTVHFTKNAPDLASQQGIILVGHELFHVLQQKEIGWRRYLFQYIIDCRFSHFLNWRKHPLEEPAYTKGDEIRCAISK